MSLISAPGAKSDVMRGQEDPNPIIDPGCPRSVGGKESAEALCRAMGLEFKTRKLDCEPFMHGYGKECSEAELVYAIWDLPIKDMTGIEVKIPFFLTRGSGFLLLGNEICHQSYLLGPENMLVIPPMVRRLSQRQTSFETYTDPTASSDSQAVRTYLLVVPSKLSAFKAFFSSQRSLAVTQNEGGTEYKKYNNGKAARRFANKLHSYTHLHIDDMVTLCERGGVMTPVLRQALEVAAENCSSCKETGRPSTSKKVSFSKVLSTFNAHVQIDYFFIVELTKLPILHMIDTHTGYSATAIVDSREMELAAQEFELKWIDMHGPPKVVSGD